MRNNHFRVISCFFIIIVSIIGLLARGFCAEYPQEVAKEIARKHYDYAREFYLQGDFERARQEFREVLNVEPGHQGARWYLKLIEKILDRKEKTLGSYLEEFRKRNELKKIKREDKRQDQISTTLDSLEQDDTIEAVPTPQEYVSRVKTLPNLKKPSPDTTAETAVSPLNISPQSAEKPGDQDLTLPSDLADKTTQVLIEEKEGDDGFSQARELYQEGKQYMDQGQYAEAMACFDKVIKLGESPQR